MNFFLIVMIFFCQQICIASQKVNQLENDQLQSALLQKVSKLQNHAEIIHMIQQVDKFKQEYGVALQKICNKNLQNNQNIQLLEAEVSSYNAQIIINNFMKNPESLYYHKVSRWSDDMHHKTFEMIKSRAALRRDPYSFDFQKKVKLAEASLLLSIHNGGIQYIYPPDRAVKIQQLTDLQQKMQLDQQQESKLLEQCKILEVVSAALLHKKQSRQLYLDVAWKNFAQKIAQKSDASQSIKNKNDIVSFAYQLKVNKQVIYNSVLQETLQNLIHEIAREQFQYALYDKKAATLVENCLKQAQKELFDEQVQAKLQAQRIEHHAKIVRDKEKSKAKKERQKEHKQVLAEQYQQELDELDKIIESNKSFYNKLTPEDLKIFKSELEQKYIACIMKYGILYKSEISPILFSILNKCGLSQNEISEEIGRMIKDVIFYKKYDKSLGFDDLKKHLFEKMQLTHELYSMQMIKDLVNIEMIVVEVVKKIS